MKTLIKSFMKILFGLTILLAVSGCSDSPKKVIAKNQDAFEKMLESLDALGDKAANENLGEDRLLLPKGAPVLDLNDVGSYGYEGRSNAQLFTIQDLLDPEEKSPAMHFYPALVTWQKVRAMVKEGKFPKIKKESLEALQRFSRWRYAVIIKTSSVRAPQIATAPVSTNVTDKAIYSSGTFTSGEIEGDVLLYDLNDNNFLGSFPFSAKSSDKVESTTYGGDSSEEALLKAMERDFSEQIKKSVLYGLLDRLPKSQIYMNGNLRQSVMLDREGKSE